MRILSVISLPNFIKMYNDLSDFITKTEILRREMVAFIVCDYVDGRPVRLIGFNADSSQSDFEIKERGYAYYTALLNILKK